METKSFLLAVDPALLDISAGMASHVEVKYSICLGSVNVYEVAIPAHVLKNISDSKKFYVEVETAAKQHHAANKNAVC